MSAMSDLDVLRSDFHAAVTGIDSQESELRQMHEAQEASQWPDYSRIDEYAADLGEDAREALAIAREYIAALEKYIKA